MSWLYLATNLQNWLSFLWSHSTNFVQWKYVVSFLSGWRSEIWQPLGALAHLRQNPVHSNITFNHRLLMLPFGFVGSLQASEDNFGDTKSFTAWINVIYNYSILLRSLLVLRVRFEGLSWLNSQIFSAYSSVIWYFLVCTCLNTTHLSVDCTLKLCPTVYVTGTITKRGAV